MHCDRNTLHALVHLTVQDNAALSKKKIETEPRNYGHLVRTSGFWGDIPNSS